jgi:hypothetical protein
MVAKHLKYLNAYAALVLSVHMCHNYHINWLSA